MTSNNCLSYKGFTATVEFSSEDMLLVGKVDDIDSLILVSAESVADLEIEFRGAIDEYLADCEARAVEPEKPCKGTFNVRIGSDLHRRAVTTARRRGQSLNDFVKAAVSQAVEGSHAVTASAAVVFEKRESVPSVEPWGTPLGYVGAYGTDDVFGKPH